MKSDFLSWAEEHDDLFHELYHHDSLVFDQWNTVLKVTTYIDQLPEKDRNVDLDIIYDVGYAYLYQKVNDFKQYLANYFHHDIHQILAFDRAIYYLFYMEDVKDSLLEQERYTPYATEVIEPILEKLEKALHTHKKVAPEQYEEWDQLLLDVIPHKQTVLTTPEIFAQAAEELDI